MNTSCYRFLRKWMVEQSTQILLYYQVEIERDTLVLLSFQVGTVWTNGNFILSRKHVMCSNIQMQHCTSFSCSASRLSQQNTQCVCITEPETKCILWLCKLVPWREKLWGVHSHNFGILCHLHKGLRLGLVSFQFWIRPSGRDSCWF